MAWTSARNRYKTQCVRRAVINKDILFFPLFDCFSIYRLSFSSCRNDVEVWKYTKKNEISHLISTGAERKTFSHLSANSPYCTDTCFFHAGAGVLPMKQRITTPPLDNNIMGHKIFILFLVFLLKIISNCRIFWRRESETCADVKGTINLFSSQPTK